MASHQNHFSHKLLRIAAEHRFARRHTQQFNSLTPREKEILCLLTKGYCNPEIAACLHISLHTVKNHRKHIKSKLEADSLVDMIRYALAFDLI